MKRGKRRRISADVVSSITKVFKSRTVRWAEHMVRMGEKRKEQLFVGQT
jgi:hypothetical protein